MTSAMNEKVHGVNSITIASEPFLIAGGYASHLVAESRDKDMARPAVEPWRWDVSEEWQSSYSRAELEALRWSQRTLCGRDWSHMEPGDGPGFLPWSTPAHAPSCRTCLRIVSGRLESRPPDDRIPLLAALVMQEVLDHGQSRVNGVPGNQAEALREGIRRELRRHNLRGRTYLLNQTVFVASDDAYEALSDVRKDEIQQQLMYALDSSSDSGLSPPTRGMNWYTWRVR